MENTIEVESAEVAMDISLEENITRNGKSLNQNYLLEQTHQSVCTICNERAGMNIICCSECHYKTHYKYSLLPPYQLYNFLRRKRSISAQIKHLLMFPI